MKWLLGLVLVVELANLGLNYWGTVRPDPTCASGAETEATQTALVAKWR